MNLLIQISQCEEQREKDQKKKKEPSLRNSLNNRNYSNTCVIGVPKTEQTTNGAEKKFLKKQGSNITNLIKGVNLQIQNA